MANPVQWTVDQFWAQLQSVKNQITAVDSSLASNKTQLQAMYTTARTAGDTHGMAVLNPLIHQNSVLRLSYLKPIKDDFNKAVAAASNALKAAGLTTPQLSGMGVVPALVIVPVICVTLVLGMIAAVKIVNRMTQAQITDTETTKAILTNPNTTPAEKLALADAQKKAAEQRLKDNPPPFDVGALVGPLALVALIVLGPQIMRMLPARRGAA